MNAKSGSLSLVTAVALTLTACAGPPVREQCDYSHFQEYPDFDVATLRYVVATEELADDARPFLAFDGRDRAGEPISLAVRLDALDDSLRRDGCPARSVLRTYRVSNSDSAWRLFWLTADDVTAGFGVRQADSGTPRTFGVLLFDTATGNAPLACGCLR